MAEAAEESITVVCNCGKKLKAPASAVGRKARCKACGNIMTIEAPATIGFGDEVDVPLATAQSKAQPPARPAPTARKNAAKAAPPAPADDDPLGALYALAQEEKRATPIEDDTVRCPQCVSPLAPNAVICTNCGFNIKTGKALQTAKVTDKPKKSLFGGSKSATSPSGKKVEDAMAPQGSFMLGVVGSIVGGVVGAIVWFLIAHFTGYEVGYVAIGVGALAGVGMQIGQKGYSRAGGVVAALVAFLAIMCAKAAVFAAILMSPESEALADLEDYDERVVDTLMREELSKKGLDYDETDEEEDAEAAKVVGARLAKMSPAEINAMVAKADAAEDREELVGYITDQEVEARSGATGNEPDFGDYVRASKAAETKVAAMSDEQIKTELAKHRAAEDAEDAADEEAVRAHAEATGKSLDSDDGSADTVVAVAIGAILIYMIFGGIWSIIFLFLAVSVAYKTASGGVSG